MVKKVQESFLKKATPYMLRNDGKLLECGDLHPYIYYTHLDLPKKEIKNLLTNYRGEFLKWFYHNSNDDIVMLIDRLISAVISNNYIELTDEQINYLKNNFNIFDLPNAKDFDIEEEFKQLDNETNQMFCRVRTSDIRNGGSNKDIYFRISSVNFNWFPIIWQIVFDNKSFIEKVNICTDPQSKNEKIIYTYNGIKLWDLDIEDFLTLNGNPIIESKNLIINKLQKGYSLQEATNYTHPGHINNAYSVLEEEYLERVREGEFI